MRTASTNEDLAQQHTQPISVEAVGWVIRANDLCRSLTATHFQPREATTVVVVRLACTLTSFRPALPATNPTTDRPLGG